MVAQEGMACVYEQDLVYEALHLAGLPRVAGATEAFLEGGQLLCGLAAAHEISTLQNEHFVIEIGRSGPGL